MGEFKNKKADLHFFRGGKVRDEGRPFSFQETLAFHGSGLGLWLDRFGRVGEVLVLVQDFLAGVGVDVGGDAITTSRLGHSALLVVQLREARLLGTAPDLAQ